MYDFYSLTYPTYPFNLQIGAGILGQQLICRFFKVMCRLIHCNQELRGGARWVLQQSLGLKTSHNAIIQQIVVLLKSKEIGNRTGHHLTKKKVLTGHDSTF